MNEEATTVSPSSGIRFVLVVKSYTTPPMTAIVLKGIPDMKYSLEMKMYHNDRILMMAKQEYQL